MNLNYIFYFIFSISAILSSIMVISAWNAVYSVLFLILTFFNMACLLLLMGAEFFAFLLLIVYVGAIAILFLFVVMMLNIKIKPTFSLIFSKLPISIVLFSVLGYQFYQSFLDLDLLNLNLINLNTISWINESKNLTNTYVIGCVLYTNYSLLFILASCILLVAMLGVIVLTMHQKINVKKQKIELQLLRIPKGVIKFIQLRI